MHAAGADVSRAMAAEVTGLLAASREAVETARREGVAGFYKGFGANLLRVAPQSAVTLVAYESVKDALNRLDPPGPPA